MFGRIVALVDSHRPLKWQALCMDLVRESCAQAEIRSVSSICSGVNRISEKRAGKARWLTGTIMKGCEAIRPVGDHWSLTASGEGNSRDKRVPGLDSLEQLGVDADLVLNFSALRIDTGWSSLPELGVWRFEPNLKNCSGNIPYAEEILSNKSPVKAELIGGGGGLGREKILMQGFFSPREIPYGQMVDQICFEMAQWPARALRQISGVEEWKTEFQEPYLGMERKRARNWLRDFLFGGKLLIDMFKRKTLSLVSHDQWAIAAVGQSISDIVEKGLDESKVTFLIKPSSRDDFYADPFALLREDGIHLLYEELEHSRPVGRISRARFSEDLKMLESSTIWETGRHISYPFLFHGEDGSIYCAPEKAESGILSLYQATDFPGEWVEVARISEEIQAVDPTFFRYGGFWWVGYTDGSIDENSALCFMFAESLRGIWRSHERNPVKIDVGSARPAGPVFTHRGEVFRPAQDSSVSYGGRVALNRILELTPRLFKEETVSHIGPFRNGPYNKGLHTISPAGEITVVDCKRKIFAPAVFRRRLRNKAPFLNFKASSDQSLKSGQ